jgi:DNA repair and recombination RAD54-like protein
VHRSIEYRKTKRLGPAKQFTVIRPGDLRGFQRPSLQQDVLSAGGEEEEEEDVLPTISNLPPFEPLILWSDPNDPENKIEVIPQLASKLRPHQREGVQFLFECTMGLRGFDGQGCILADDMGLGKTLMSITTLWTLLNQGFKKGDSAVKRVVVVCPTSLVGNWDNEIRKWVGEQCPTFAVKSDPKKMIKSFLSYRSKCVLIISYETQRLYSKLFEQAAFSYRPSAKQSTNNGAAAPADDSMLQGHSNNGICDLLICDEAHKLKNAESGLAKSLNTLPAKKRILLSGTPMQNELTEFFNMVNFCNPSVLGNLSEFRKR